MDFETGKAIISAISAVVAVIGAALAFRARLQTRTDIFEAQRDALILAIAENDNQCSLLVLQCAFARAEIERVIPKIVDEAERQQADAYLKNITEIKGLAKVSDLREYDDKKLDALGYTEDSLATLRRMARGEQVNSKHFHSASSDLIFEQINRFTRRHEAQI